MATALSPDVEVTAAAPSRDGGSGPVLRGGAPALAAVAGLWGLLLVVLVRQRLFASHDSVNNYAHVWYVADQFWHHHRIPLHMPVLGHGVAYAFPYAFLPWMSAALAWPLLGDRAVTLWLAIGLVGTAAAMFWALPELRRHPWAGAAALLNPALVVALLFGQLPFLWAVAFLFLAIGAWRRGRRPPAAGFAFLAQAGHPAVMLPIMAGVVLVRLVWEPDRAALARWWAASLVLSAPAAALVATSPVLADSPAALQWPELARTVSVRILVVALPLLLAAAARRPAPGWRWIGPVTLLALVAGNVGYTKPANTPPAWRALVQAPDRVVADFTRSADFIPGATYRWLQASGQRVGMYDLLRAGGRLDSEFFPESMHWADFPDAAAYAAFLERRNVDFVLDCPDFDRRFATNEHMLLEALAAPPPASGPAPVRRTRLVSRTPFYSLYQVRSP